LIALFDNDKEGIKGYNDIAGIEDNTQMYKKLTSEQSENRCYAFKIPAITDSPKYCPIEFLYDIDILLSNNVIEKRDYRDYLNLYRDENRSASDNEILMKEFQEGKIPRPYIVKDNMKKYFSEIIQKESDVKLFCNFQNLFHILK
jgi:hypothetical protein